jgi:hypothetical protein
MVVSRICPDAIVIDTGSTTTDLIPIVSGHVAALGKTDPERLASGELVYTGVVRTPAEAIASTLPWRGGTVGVSAEGFALSGDVYLWLGQIATEDYENLEPRYTEYGVGDFEARFRLSSEIDAEKIQAKLRNGCRARGGTGGGWRLRCARPWSGIPRFGGPESPESATFLEPPQPAGSASRCPPSRNTSGPMHLAWRRRRHSRSY